MRTMKWLFLVLPLVHAQLVDPAADLICPDSNPFNCYPKVFEATRNWQPVKEGQLIPPGLHVRLNLNSGKTEGKLMDDEDEEGKDVAVVPDAEPEPEAALDKDTNKIQEALLHYKDAAKDAAQGAKEFVRSKVDDGELADFESAVAEVGKFAAGGDIARFEKALDTLVELSHDLEFGHRLTDRAAVFAALQHAADVARDVPAVVEKVFRIMGSSLRNNAEAIENVLAKQDDRFFARLFDTLGDPQTLEVVQLRVVGVLQALATNTKYAYLAFNVRDAAHGVGINRLLAAFPNLGKAARERVANTLEDLGLLEDEQAGDKRSIETSVRPEHKVSMFLQKLLSEGSAASEQQLQALFHALVDIHSKYDVQPTKAFLQWLSKEAEERRSGVKQRDALYSKTDDAFDLLIVEARHAVFGNPNTRKMQDEL